MEFNPTPLCRVIHTDSPHHLLWRNALARARSAHEPPLLSPTPWPHGRRRGCRRCCVFVNRSGRNGRFALKRCVAFAPDTLAKLRKNHPIYNSFFKFPDGPPQTQHELNGWGDNVIHDYTRGVEYRNRLGVFYTNQDYGCEWDYDWKNKRFRKTDNTRFAVNVYAMT